MPIHKRVKVQIEFTVPESRLDDDKLDVDLLQRMVTPRAWVKNFTMGTPIIETIKVPTVKSRVLRQLNEYKRILRSITDTISCFYGVTVMGRAFTNYHVIDFLMKPNFVGSYGKVEVVSCVCEDSKVTLRGRYSYQTGQELVVNLADPKAMELLKRGIEENVGRHHEEVERARPNAGKAP